MPLLYKLHLQEADHVALLVSARDFPEEVGQLQHFATSAIGSE